MKIGLGQINIVWEDKAKNQIQCHEMMAEAKKKGVDFLLFPEMTLTGFSMKTASLGETLDNSPSIAFFKQEAIKYQINVCFGMIVTGKEKPENHCIIIGKDGNLLADYAKIHPFSYGTESHHYAGGENIAFCQVEDLTVSPLVCYDLRFPEVFQACSKKSGLITIIANWPAPRRCHWISLLKARAIENQCFVAAVNRCGEGDGLKYQGDSMLVNPYGEIVAYAPEGAGLTVAELDAALVNQYRNEFPLKADRKPHLYAEFYKQEKS